MQRAQARGATPISDASASPAKRTRNPGLASLGVIP